MYESTSVVIRDFRRFRKKKSAKPIKESSLRLLLLINRQKVL